MSSLNKHVPFPDFVQSQERRLSTADVIVENQRGEALVVKTSYLPHWSFPGGIIDVGESPSQAAVRELQEETGLDYSVNEIEFASVIHRRVLDVDIYVFVFRLIPKLDESARITIDQREIISIDWVSKQDVRSKARGRYNTAVRNWASENPREYVDYLTDNY